MKDEDFEITDSEGNTLLSIACNNGYNKIVKFLLRNGSDVNTKNNEGDSPLHMSCMSGYHRVVKTLIKNGADINSKNLKGETPLHISSYVNELKITKILMENGADINAKNNIGETSFLMACYVENLGVVKLFLEKNGNSNINIVDNDGCSPLIGAASVGNYDIMVVLIKNGANVETKDNNGKIFLEHIHNDNTVVKIETFIKNLEVTGLGVKPCKR